MRTYAAIEDEKYSWLYEHGYGDGPVEGTLAWALPKLQKPWSTVVDLGCGHATARQWLYYDRYVGVDIASSQITALDEANEDPKSFFVHGNLEEIQFTEHFGLAICIDVLEHIPVERLPKVLDRIVDVADQLIVSVATCPSNFKSREGKNLHLTVREFPWWLNRFKRRGPVVATDSHRALICV